MNNVISLIRKCSPLPLLYTLIKVLNSKGIMIYCCARLKLCSRNSKSFCSSQGLSLFILPCRMRQIGETKALKHRKENAYSWEWLKLSIVSLKDENFSPNCRSLTFKEDLRSLYWFVSNSNLDYLGFISLTKTSKFKHIE